MKDVIKCTFGVMFFVFFAVVFFIWIREDALKYRMNNACLDILNAETTDMQKRDDGSGNLLVYDYEIFKEKRVATVTYVGSDGLLGTDDDVSVSKTDYNKTYLGGKFVGERAKQFLDGVIEGDKTPSKFEEK